MKDLPPDEPPIPLLPPVSKVQVRRSNQKTGSDSSPSPLALDYCSRVACSWSAPRRSQVGISASGNVYRCAPRPALVPQREAPAILSAAHEWIVSLQLSSASIVQCSSVSSFAVFGWLTCSLPPTPLEKAAMFLLAFRSASRVNPYRTHSNCLPVLLLGET